MRIESEKSRGLLFAAISLAILFVLIAAPHAEAADQTLTVNAAGNGQGYVTSAPGGIDCGQNLTGHATCSADFAEGQTVTLTAHTIVSFQWGGACASSLPGQLVCTVTMNQAESVTATFSKLSPGTSVVTNDSFLGSSIWASGTVQGGLVPAQGTLTFRLYGVGDTNCTGAPVYTDTKVVTTQGSFGTGPYTPTQAGAYRWTATYSGDENNNGSATACNEPNTVANVAQASPGISNSATNANIGSSISNTATLSGGANPTGTMTFRLYGADDATCSGTPVFTSTVPVNGAGSYNAGNFTPTQAGAYRWRTSYSGDVNNHSLTTNCSASGSISTVAKAAPQISMSATNAMVGSTIAATGTISGGILPTGTITFRAYGPADAQCQGTPAFTGTAIPVSGNGAYGSGGFATTRSGIYHWTASYSGDANNSPLVSNCGAPNSQSTVAKANPSLAHDGIASTTVGSSLMHHALLSGGYNLTGSITFRAYGPNDADCSEAPVFSGQSSDIVGPGSYGIGSFTPTQAGQYHWVAIYSGDENNSVAVAPCSAAASTVAKASPSITADAEDAPIGEAISATATVADGYSLGGTITFTLFAKGDTACAGQPVFTATVPVGDGTDVPSGGFTPTEAGSYRWVAAYSGDANNQAAQSTCDAPGSTSTVAAAGPSITVSATDATIGSSVSSTATLADGVAPGGTVRFEAYGPGDACSGSPAFASSVNVNGNGAYESGPFTPDTPGSYVWIVEYSGDVNNDPTGSACGDATSTVDKAGPDLNLTASGDVRLSEKISSSAALIGGHEPSGDVTFRLYGPDDQSCSGQPAFEATSPLAADGTASSPEFEPKAVGEYRWVAEYAGDADNEPSAVDCANAKLVQVTPLTCPAVDVSAISARPRVIVKGRMTKGVRARISVSRPSVLAISAKLEYRFKGKTRRVNLGQRSLRNNDSRAFRLPLLKNIRKRLSYGDKVKLTLAITATPNEPRGCTSPPRTETTIKVPVVHVLTRPQAP